ncbi:putative Zn-dependent protease, partial [Geosmithia morbida]
QRQWRPYSHASGGDGNGRKPTFEEQVRQRLRQAQAQARRSHEYQQVTREDRARHGLATARPLLSDATASMLARAGTGTSSRAFMAGCIAAAVLFYLANSQTVPVSGRRRFNFLGDSYVESIGSREADAVVSQVEAQGGRFLPHWDPRYRHVQRVMGRLVPVSGMTDVNWRIRVIDDDSNANAFVTPGGHLFVFTGILRVCGNSDGLAAVLGHEIAHNVASHASERLSAAYVANFTSGSLFFMAGALRGLALLGIWTVTGGMYLQELLYGLPMGRRMESEADYIGLMMMAEACYDPREAVAFWQRMSHLQSKGYEVPEMLSTHPSNDNRIQKMREWLPDAMAKRNESDCMGGAGAWADQFRDTLRRRQLIRI